MIAVLGLYNCGSSAIAGMLDALGVNMGAPYWHGHATDGACYFEPLDLGHHLRRWWNEPRMIEMQTRQRRVAFLKAWAALQKTVGTPVGAKHPLLSLSGLDLLEAWGPQTRFIWSHRPLGESIDGLRRRPDWFSGHDAEDIQCRLWHALAMSESRLRPVRMEWKQVKADPIAAAYKLAEIAGIQVSHATIRKAAAVIRD